MNRQDLLRIERWAKDIPAMDFPPSQTVFLNLHQHRKQKKNCLIKKLRIDPEEGAGILARNPNLYLKDMKEFCARFIGPTGNRIFTCGSGFRSGCVDAYGYFWPCMQLRSPSLAYDLKKGSLKDALLNFFPKLRKIRTTNKEYLLRCGRCFLRGLCQQCPGISWLETGKLDTPVEYFCQAAHSQARLLGLIEKGELAWEVENWKDRVARLSQIEFLKFN
jgi:radical SAM protein with 4Fe4S-binding SPASM domain